MRALICLFLVACSIDKPADVLPPAPDALDVATIAIAVSSGDAQTGTAGEALAMPFVAIVTTGGQPFVGAAVSFLVADGGGTLSIATATTDASGLVQTQLTLGAKVGQNTVQALVSGATSTATTFTASSIAGPAAKLVAVSGDGQAGAVASQLAAPLVVEVSDANDNPVDGASVAFTIASGGGSIGTATATTDASGHAQTSLTLGGTAGVNTVSAHVAGISPVTFSATSSTGTVSQLKIASGDAQTNVVGTALPLPMVVLAQDAHGNASANVPITFAIASGAGQLSTTTAMTDANGHAQTTLTLGTIVAANTVTARAAGITTTLTFTAQSVAGALWKIAIVSGNNQSATVGTSLAAPLVVRIQDMYNNPISGTTVTFSASVGGGTVTVPITTTNILGQADTNLALSQTVGLTDVTASASGVGVIFVVTRSHGAAQKVLPTSGSNQSAAIGSTFAQPLVVTVQDTYGNPVPGATISFSVSVLDATPQSAPVITDSQGRGSCTLTAGSQFNVTYSVTAALGTISTVFTESNLI